MDWVRQNPAIAIALIAAFSALFGGLIAAIAKFVFDFYLSERIKRRWKTIDTKRQYSLQIVRAADDLAGRISNMSRHLTRVCTHIDS
jgi:biopolymer transport protein ExbB/TolQ